MTDRERTYDVGPLFAFPDLSGCVPPGGRIAARPRRELREELFDTTDLRLVRAGGTLRWEHADTDVWVLTLPPGPVGPHVDVPLDGGSAADVAPLVTAYVRTAPIGQVGRVETRRRAYELTDAAGDVLVDVVDDTVAVLVGGAVTQRFRELHVAAREGSAGLVDDVGSFLVAAGATPVTAVPRHVRALGPAAAAAADLPATEPAGRRSTVGDVVRAALRHDVERLLAHDPLYRLRMPLPDGDTAVHQMRVACRRMRALLRAYRPVLDEAWADDLRERLRWLADVLGAARDAEVLADRLVRTASTDPTAPLNEAAVGRHAASVAERRADAVAALDAALDSDHYRELLDIMVAAAREPRLTDAAEVPAASALPALVRRPWRALRRAVRELDAESPDTAWHRVRILAKRARYTVEAAATVDGSAARRLGKRLARVQDVLGQHQDAVVAAQMWQSLASSGGADEDLTLTAGRLVERERRAVRAARAEFPGAWRRARKAGRWLD